MLWELQDDVNSLSCQDLFLRKAVKIPLFKYYNSNLLIYNDIMSQQNLVNSIIQSMLRYKEADQQQISRNNDQQQEKAEAENPLVKVYLRKSNRKSARIHIFSKTTVDQIKLQVQQRLSVAPDQQILFINGKNITSYSYLKLEHNDIIHIKDQAQFIRKPQTLKLNFKIINFLNPENSTLSKSYDVDNQSIVLQLIQKIRSELELGQVHTYLLESSRVLNENQTFRDQEVISNSEIVFLINKNLMKTSFTNDSKEQIFKDISDLLDFNEQQTNKPQKIIQSQSGYESPVKKIKILIDENGEKDKEDKKQFLKKPKEPISSGEQKYNQFQQYSPAPNFKKKINQFAKEILQETPLRKKIKTSKSRQYLDEVLRSQKKTKEESGEDENQKCYSLDGISTQKSSTVISNNMPIKERRKIKLEIEKLFGNESSKKKQESQKEGENQEKIIKKSPQSQLLNFKPLSQEERKINKQSNKMRFSMKSRPQFLLSLNKQ